MTELQTGDTIPPGYIAENERLPLRAWKMAMRILQKERECAGRGRLTVDVIFIDGEWLLGFTEPGKLERLGE